MYNLNSLIVQRWQKWFQLLSQNNSLNLELLLMLCNLTIPGTSPSHPAKCSSSHQVENQVLEDSHQTSQQHSCGNCDKSHLQFQCPVFNQTCTFCKMHGLFQVCVTGLKGVPALL